MPRGFKSGKGNPINVLKQENQLLRAEIARLRTEPALREFALRTGESIMVLLAQKPLAVWPKEAQFALRHQAAQTPVLADLYKQLLPKE